MPMGSRPETYVTAGGVTAHVRELDTENPTTNRRIRQRATYRMFKVFLLAMREGVDNNNAVAVMERLWSELNDRRAFRSARNAESAHQSMEMVLSELGSELGVPQPEQTVEPTAPSVRERLERAAQVPEVLCINDNNCEGCANNPDEDEEEVIMCDYDDDYECINGGECSGCANNPDDPGCDCEECNPDDDADEMREQDRLDRINEAAAMARPDSPPRQDNPAFNIRGMSNRLGRFPGRE